jgi:MarR family transcriptional regulator, lower aerobic nicotinate degradation pathway regulator
VSGKPTTTHPPLSERAVFRLYKIGQLIIQAAEEQLVDLGLTGRRYFVLGGAGQAGPVSQQDLARMLGIDPTTIVAIVDELESGGFLRRERSSTDRRRYELHLTDAGRRALESADEVIDRVESEFFSSLPPAELLRFQNTAGKVVAQYWP